MVRSEVSRIVQKIQKLNPQDVSAQCLNILTDIDSTLMHTITKTGSVDACATEDHVTSLLEVLDAQFEKWGWDMYMSKLYLEIRSDLTVLEMLVGIGQLSIKTLLYERQVLVSELRKANRNHGFFKSELTRTNAQLKTVQHRACCDGPA